jgi:tRNA (guanine-N7-)-methyltransferase
MPNIQTDRYEPVTLPKSVDGYTFLARARSRNGEELILTRFEDKNFFLQVIKRERNKRCDYLIKAEKLTRVTPVSIMQKGLKAFAKLHDMKLTFSNVSPQKSSIVKEDAFTILKDIDYFATSLPYDKPLLIEVGFGSGRHLLYQAKAHPDKLLIGIEIHRPSIEQVIKQCKLQNIDNILIANFDARIFLQLIASNSVEKIFVHFPVPWDKKPHRRVISKPFIDEAMRVLQPSGRLELRTDSENYFSYAFETFNALNSYDLQIKKNHDLPVTSKYEARWRRMEKNIYDLILTNRHTSPPKEPMGELTFDNSCDFEEIKRGFVNTTLKSENAFVHFEALYTFDQNSEGYKGLIKLSMGAFEKPEHKYLLFKENKIQYFPKSTIAINQNIKAHSMIKEFFHV